MRCLGALAGASHRDFEVIICENGGADSYKALLAAIPERLPGGLAVRAVAAPGNIGFAGGVNRCLEETPDADAWWVLNPDTQPDQEALALKVARLSAGDVGAVGCTLHRPNGKVQSHGGLWRAAFGRAESIGNGDPWPGSVDARRWKPARTT